MTLSSFQVSDYQITLNKIFKSLLDSLPKSKRDKYEPLVQMLFTDDDNNNEITPIDCLTGIYQDIKNFIPSNKLNNAKLNTIDHIIKTIQRNEIKDEKKDEKKGEKKSAIIEFVKENRNKQILDTQRQIKETENSIADTTMERDFMISQINNRLAKVSKDLDEYITVSLNLNDPVELDKTDKKMIRTVIDAIHITNILNVDLKAKSSNKK